MSLGLLALLMAHWIRQQIISSCCRGHHTSKGRSQGQDGSPVRLMSWDQQRLPVGKNVTEAFDKADFLNRTWPRPLTPLPTKFYFQHLPLTDLLRPVGIVLTSSDFVTRHRSCLPMFDESLPKGHTRIIRILWNWTAK